jgi:hypothetical protein
MRPLRICIYGGTGLEEPAPTFVEELAREILDTIPSVIVTGGFLHFRDQADAISTDHAALRGARRHARTAGTDLHSCFEAFVPDPALDRNKERGGVVRMSARDGVNVRRMRQKSPLGRRLAMIHQVDVLVTIGGKRHTNEVLEQALELNTPALPLAFAGGDSAEFWTLYQDQVVHWFSLDDDAESVKRLDELTASAVGRDTPAMAKWLAGLIRQARVGRCLVLMPFADHDGLYRVIKEAVEDVMACERLDHLPGSYPIRSNFVDAVERSLAVIADVSDVNPNVMYEIGFAIAKGVKPMLFCRQGSPVENLPVYLRDLNIARVASDDALAQHIRQHLLDVKKSSANK